MIYVVIGMHKCGTTLVSQLLHAAGVDMIEYFPLPEELEYKYGGQYESITTKRINEVLLQSRGIPSARIRKTELFDIDRMSTIAQRYIKTKENQTWGFKDPRTTLTYLPFWSRMLSNQDHTLIVTYREVGSFLSRTAWYNFPHKIRLVKRYIEYYQECIAIVAKNKAESCYVVNFEDLKRDTSIITSLLSLKSKVPGTVVSNKLDRKVRLSSVDKLVIKLKAKQLNAIDSFFTNFINGQ